MLRLQLLFRCLIVMTVVEAPGTFPSDRLSPYEEGWHGSGRSRRDISQCQHIGWENRTYEWYQVELPIPESTVLKYNLYRFADTVRSQLDNPLSIHRTRYLLGSIAFVENPYHTLSVLEPYEPGGCEVKYFSGTRSTVTATSSRRKLGCKLALNAGYFSVTSGQCLGNIVSDGRIVQSTKEQNANFGIRVDGTIVIGYIPEEEVLDGSYQQLVSGVLWLVRNGTNYVNESMRLECASHQDTGKMSTFVEVLSARTAIGYDNQGRVVVAYVEGQTHHRGANLYEFADLLISHGVVNAINLDGGGSATFVHDQVLMNYPSDHCSGNPAYRCERQVSTVLCFHDVQCLEPSCNDHGVCDKGECTCNPPWFGVDCNLLNCSLVECSDHGSCTEGVCVCDSGWEGQMCEKVCSPGYHGSECTSKCWCYGQSECNSVTGECQCPPGYTGFGCWKECDPGFYGPDCKSRCPDHNCSGNGNCSSFDGTCHCSSNWTGPACNESSVYWGSVTSKVLLTATSTSDDKLTNSASEVAVEVVFTSVENIGSTKVSGVLEVSMAQSMSAAIDSCTPVVQQNCNNCGLIIFVLCLVTTASVIVHIFICVRLKDSEQKQGLPKRRKLRKKERSQYRLSQSSSDCSI